MTIHLETARVILRDWQDSDLENFARINGDPVVMEHYPTYLDEAATKRLIKHFQNHIDKKGYGFFALEHKETGDFMGFSGFAAVPSSMPFAPATELAWRIDYDYWGAKYASEIADVLIHHAFQVVKLKELVAYCVQENERAGYVLQKIGFSQDKKASFTYAPSRNKKAVQTYDLYRLKP